MEQQIDKYFDKAKNFQLKNRVEKLLSDLPIDFYSVLHEAKNLTIEESNRKPSHYKAKNYMAETMYGNIIGILMDNYRSFIFFDETKRPYLKLDKDIRIYLKKLNRDYLPNNITTSHVKKLNCQDLFDDDDGIIHVLYVGYILTNNDWIENLQNVALSYLNRIYTDMPAWIIDLEQSSFRKNHKIRTYQADTIVHEDEDVLLVTVPVTDDNEQVI